MDREHKNLEQALTDALGKPKYYVDAPDKKEGERYFWFPTLGDSMTNHSEKSIPSGSLVLGRLLTLQTVHDIPLQKPIVVIIDDEGQQFCLLKCACYVKTVSHAGAGADGDAGSEQFCLRSYNTHYHDFWLPLSCVKFIFLVERVRLPNGKEFVP